MNKRNLIAILAYPVTFCAIVIIQSFITEFFGITRIPKILGHFSILLLFIIPPMVSSWIAKNPIKCAVLGALLHQILFIIFASPIIRFFLTPLGPTSQKILSSIPAVKDFHFLIATTQILAVVFLPVVMLLAVVGGFLGLKIKSLKSFR